MRNTNVKHDIIKKIRRDRHPPQEPYIHREVLIIYNGQEPYIYREVFMSFLLKNHK